MGRLVTAILEALRRHWLGNLIILALVVLVILAINRTGGSPLLEGSLTKLFRRGESNQIEVRVESVLRNETGQYWVVLKVEKQDQYVPIGIGVSEAEAIARGVEKIAASRPQTHDLLKSAISEMGGKVTEVTVTDVSNGVFYARIGVDSPKGHLELDSRPSDAIALAVRFGVPIFVEEKVLKEAGVDASSRTPSSLARS